MKMKKKRRSNFIVKGVKGEWVTIRGEDSEHDVLLPRRDHSLVEMKEILSHTLIGQRLVKDRGGLKNAIEYLAARHLRMYFMNYRFVEKRRDSIQTLREMMTPAMKIRIAKLLKDNDLLK